MSKIQIFEVGKVKASAYLGSASRLKPLLIVINQIPSGCQIQFNRIEFKDGLQSTVQICGAPVIYESTIVGIQRYKICDCEPVMSAAHTTLYIDSTGFYEAVLVGPCSTTGTVDAFVQDAPDDAGHITDAMRGCCAAAAAVPLALCPAINTLPVGTFECADHIVVKHADGTCAQVPFPAMTFPDSLLITGPRGLPGINGTNGADGANGLNGPPGTPLAIVDCVGEAIGNGAALARCSQLPVVVSGMNTTVTPNTVAGVTTYRVDATGATPDLCALLGAVPAGTYVCTDTLVVRDVVGTCKAIPLPEYTLVVPVAGIGDTPTLALGQTASGQAMWFTPAQFAAAGF
jgi:hypothetical protein